MILASDSSTKGEGEGSGGAGGGDEPIDSESEASDSEREEEHKEEEEMAQPNLEWMTQGPLPLLDFLHKMLKKTERMNIKFNHDNAVKAEDHLDNFYL